MRYPAPRMLSTPAAGRGCLLPALRAYALFVLASVAVAVSLGYLAAAHALRRAQRAPGFTTRALNESAGRWTPARLSTHFA